MVIVERSWTVLVGIDFACHCIVRVVMAMRNEMKKIRYLEEIRLSTYAVPSMVVL